MVSQGVIVGFFPSVNKHLSVGRQGQVTTWIVKPTKHAISLVQLYIVLDNVTAFLTKQHSFIIPLGMATNIVHSLQIASVRLHCKRLVHGLLLSPEVSSAKKVNSRTITARKGVIDVKIGALRYILHLFKQFRDILKRRQQLLFPRLDINLPYAVVSWRSITDSPIICVRIAGHGPQPCHAGIVDSVEESSVGAYSTVGNGSVESVFSHSFLQCNIIQDSKYLVRFGISIIEKELCIDRFRIPEQHCPLLHIPGSRFIEYLRSVGIVQSIDEDDTSSLIREGQMIVKAAL
mmetsp:Transcript_5074/g.10759  ORF Transcript_5074/g.10759 Transcript_5074/m.10759 type:complete len:290 (-) Transcript_5074:512-1381(-)